MSNSPFQSNEPTETKKRKGAAKDDANKLKKQKTGKERDALALNAAAKCVEILHLKVFVKCVLFTRFTTIISQGYSYL